MVPRTPEAAAGPQHLSRAAGQVFNAMVGTADDRTFFVATQLNPESSCQAFFYKFSLSADGQPSALTPLPVHHLVGLPTALAASANGRLVGYSVVECAGGPTGHVSMDYPIGHIGVIDLAAGKIARQWSYTLGEDYTNDLSMSADGRLLGYSNYNGKHLVGRVLATNTPAGPDKRYSHIVMRQPTATAIGASGHLMYATVDVAARPALAAYDTTSGQQVKVFHLWPASSQLSPLVADPAGGYALVVDRGIPAHQTLSPYVRGRDNCTVEVMHKTEMCMNTTAPPTEYISVNLSTGAVTTLPFHVSVPFSWGMAAW